jgi:hypothetical protein
MHDKRTALAPTSARRSRRCWREGVQDGDHRGSRGAPPTRVDSRSRRTRPARP